MKRFVVFSILLPLVLIVSGCNTTSAAKEIELFNGKDLAGWYTVLDKVGINKDPEAVFKVEDALLCISGKTFGYICTEKEYENYHLTVEFKWGEKKWPPRENAKRDSGIMYHFPKGRSDEVWPWSIECQIQETDCGDIWLVGPAVTANGKRYEEPYTQIVKTVDAEKPNGQWNTIEVIADGDCLTHIVNGVTVNQATDASERKGKILLQSEGAEVFYRKISLIPLR